MKPQIYLVGGTIRDKLLGLPSNDYDYVVTGANSSTFCGAKRVGKDFEVYLISHLELERVFKSKFPVGTHEVRFARVERSTGPGYSDFVTETQDVTIESDLSSRDLTINSIAQLVGTSDYIDPYGGLEDLQKKHLRHTTDKFIEDPVRVLRLARLRAKLGYDWKIAPETKVLVYSMRDSLKSLQSERVWKEFEKALALENSHIFFNTLFELGVLDCISPSIHAMTTLKEGSRYHEEASVFEHTMMMLALTSKDTPILSKLACLYHDIAKPLTYRTYGNSAGHDNPKLVEPLVDTFIPPRLRNPTITCTKHHIRIFKLREMTPQKTLKLFKDFYRNPKVLESLFDLADCDTMGRTTSEPKKTLHRGQIKDLYEALWNVSSIRESLIEDPSNAKDIVHRYQLKTIKDYKWTLAQER